MKGIAFIFGICLLISANLAEASEVASDASPPPRANPKDIADSMLLPYYDMANWFVEDLVQLSYLYDMEETLGIEFTKAEDLWTTWEDNWEDWLVYYIGYTICASVGAVLLIAMPVIGGVMACCRCCGNCGGKNPPSGKPSSCKRTGCSIALIVITAALAFGTAGVFIANENIKERLQGQSSEEGIGDTNVFAELGMSLDAVDKYLDRTIMDLNSSVLGQFISGKDNLFDTLDDIPHEALYALDSETGVVEDLGELKDFTYSLEDTQQKMEDAQATTLELNTTLTELEVALDDVKQEVDILISTCGTTECVDAIKKLSDLKVNVNTDSIDLSDAIIALDNALNTGDIVSKVNLSLSSLQTIATEVNDELQPTIDEIKLPVEEIQNDIADFIKDVDEDINKLDFESATKALDDVAEEVDEYADYVYWSVLSLGIILCVTLLCNVVGVIVGLCCRRPYPDGGCCQTDSSMGADWLLAGLTFTFVFYWIYTTIVTTAFVAGGGVHTEFCRHAVDYNNPKSARVLDIFDRIINDTLYEASGVEIEVFDVYGQCQRNISFYKALDLDARGYNISEIIDLEPVEDAVKKIAEVDITIPQIDIMDPAFTSVLEALDQGIDTLMFMDYYNQLMKDVVTEDLDEIAELLFDIATIETIPDLEAYAETLENLTISHVLPATNTKDQLHADLMQIEMAVNINLTAIAANLTSAENVIDNNGDSIIESFVNDTADEIYMDIVVLSEDIEKDVREEVGRCYPMFEAVTWAFDATCIKSLYPLNGFWYSLGWILFFFIPSIILSFVLVSEFRKPDVDDKDIGFDVPYPAAIDPYSAPNPSHMLIEPTNNTGFVNEFDNPVYTGGSDFKIPRPSLKSTKSTTNSEEFKIPRPQVYDSKNSSPPSYRSNENDESPIVNPASEDTQL